MEDGLLRIYLHLTYHVSATQPWHRKVLMRTKRCTREEAQAEVEEFKKLNPKFGRELESTWTVDL